jgi:hypothetical protein
MSTTERGTIYTLECTHPEAATKLKRLMRISNTLLVDIRARPTSRKAHGWNRATLTARYRERYVWEQRLGDLHSRKPDRGIQLGAELATGHQDAIRDAAALLGAGTSLVLLCVCGDERSCHLRLVAKRIQDALPVPNSPWEVRS